MKFARKTNSSTFIFLQMLVSVELHHTELGHIPHTVHGHPINFELP